MIQLGDIGRGSRRLPDIQASEAAECGLACLAMIAGFHGHEVDLNGLRQRFALSMSGASLRTIINIAESLGFTSRALKVADIDDLRHVKAPAILHWNLNHFVVLKAIRGDRAIIHDPARGVVSVDRQALSDHFSGVVLEVEPAANFRKVVAKIPVNLTSLWTHSHGLTGAIIQVLVLSAIIQVAAFVAPFHIQLAIDEGVAQSDDNLLFVLALGFGGVVVIQAFVELLRGWSIQYFGQMLSFQMTGNVIRHLLRLPADYFEKRHVGDLMSRIGSTTAIQDVLTRGVVATLIDGVMALVAVIIIFAYSTPLALVVVGAVALNAAIASLIFPILRRRMEAQLVVEAREQTHLMETIRAATVVKIMGREAEREGAWRNLYAGVANSALGVGRLHLILAFFQTLITSGQVVLIIWLGARAIIAGDGMSAGMLFAFLSFRQTFTDRANNLVSQLIEFRAIRLHLDRLSDIVAAEPDATGEFIDLPKVEGSLSLRSVWFRYGVGDPYVLRNLNLDVAAGDFLAVTGASGGGKTTLMKLLLGLNAPSEGQILIDGQPASPDRWRAWRQHVGVVSQDDRLFSGSIADNIAFFDPGLDMEDVHEAARRARIHDDISRMPMGYLTLVGDMGSSLSGGQKQRVLLARALYRRPSLLLLDEGTANLDEHTEDTIVDLVESLAITRIVVAHRPALLRRAKRVLILDQGELYEQQTSAAPLRETV